MISWIVSAIVAVIVLVILFVVIVIGEDIVALLPKYVRKVLIMMGVALLSALVIAIMLASIAIATVTVHSIIYR